MSVRPPEALDAAHADHLVHRDIKPSNILVTSDDFVYVVDFGIARSIGSRQTSLTITGATIGTLHYMAPERFVGHDVDGRADVYSLACVLHECLTGAPPFRGKDLPALMYAQLYSSPPQASSLVEGVPPALDAVIARGMAKDPEDRFPTAGALAAAAREAILTEAPTPPPPMTELPAPTWAELPAPTWAESPAPTRTEMPAPMWQAAPALAAWQGVAEPLGPEAGPAGNGYAKSVPDSPTQTMFAHSGGDWGGTRPPENMPQGASPGPYDGRLPPGEVPGEPARGPARRRLSLLLLAVAAVLAVPIVLVLVVSAKSNTNGASAKPNTGGATGTAGPTSSVPSVPAILTVPTVAGKIPGRADPQLRPGRAERQVRLHRQSRRGRDHRAQHGQ